ncbi:unnamed protein product, partial [Ceratitis capitata]
VATTTGEAADIFAHSPWLLSPLNMSFDPPMKPRISLVASKAEPNAVTSSQDSLLSEFMKSFGRTLPPAEVIPYPLEHLEQLKSDLFRSLSLNTVLFPQLDSEACLSTLQTEDLDLLAIDKLPSFLGNLYKPHENLEVGKGIAQNEVFLKQAYEQAGRYINSLEFTKSQEGSQAFNENFVSPLISQNGRVTNCARELTQFSVVPNLSKFSSLPLPPNPECSNLRIPNTTGRAISSQASYHNNYHSTYRNQSQTPHLRLSVSPAANLLQLNKPILEHQLVQEGMHGDSTSYGHNPIPGSAITATTVKEISAETPTTTLTANTQEATMGALTNALQPPYISLSHHTSKTTLTSAHRKLPTLMTHQPKYERDWCKEATPPHETWVSAYPSYVRKSLTQSLNSNNSNNINITESNDQTARLSQPTDDTYAHTNVRAHNSIRSKQKQKQKQKKQKSKSKSKEKQKQKRNKQQELVTYTSLGYTSNGEQLFVRHFHERDRLIREHQLKHRLYNTLKASDGDGRPEGGTVDGDGDDGDGDERSWQTTTHHEATSACLGSSGILESVTMATTKTTPVAISASESTVAFATSSTARAVATVGNNAANDIAFAHSASDSYGVCNGVDDIVPQMDRTKRTVAVLGGISIDESDTARDDLTARYNEENSAEAADIHPNAKNGYASNQMTRQRSANGENAGITFSSDLLVFVCG